MAPQATFLLGTKIALEVDRGSAPSGNRQGKAWWSGGKWADLITDGMPTIDDKQAGIFPGGHAGDRRINQQQPVVGRKWSEGDISAPVVSDFLGMLCYGAMGSTSSDMTPHITPSLLANEPIQTNPKSLVLAAQPEEGGAILRFDLKGDVNAGDVSVCGIDVYGNGASEIISFASAGTVYSRTSFSAIGASSLALSGISAGSVTVFAVKKYTHLFTSCSSAPTFSIERIGDPTAGQTSANLAFRYVGLLLQTLSLKNNAETADGIFNVSATFQGEPTAGTSAATTFNAASLMHIWPSWMLQVTRDNGTTYNKVTNLDININTGNRNFLAAAGTQGPQGGFIGPQEITGNIAILVDNELEFQKWRGASQIRLFANWTNAWKLTSALNYSFSASIPAYFEADLNAGDDDNAMSLAGTFRVVRDDSFPFQTRLVNGTPGQAYLGTAGL